MFVLKHLAHMMKQFVTWNVTHRKVLFLNSNLFTGWIT